MLAVRVIVVSIAVVLIFVVSLMQLQCNRIVCVFVVIAIALTHYYGMAIVVVHRIDWCCGIGWCIVIAKQLN